MSKHFHILVITKREFIPIEHTDPNKIQAETEYYSVVFLEQMPENHPSPPIQQVIQGGVFKSTQPQLFEDITKEIDERNFERKKTPYNANEVLFLTDLVIPGQIMSFPSPVYTWSSKDDGYKPEKVST